MTYYYVCPDCGSNLDPGEKCDCAREKKKEAESERLKVESATGQLFFDLSRATDNVLRRYLNERPKGKKSRG